jgi:DNA-directed RNA polymerase sigma subunit (sigma70/sigma32)
MSHPNPADHLPEERRKEIFRALVEAQDQEMSVPQSRQFVAHRFGVTEADIRQIEREGMEGLWPPL